MNLPIIIDLPMEAPAHVCIHVNKTMRRTTNADALALRQAFRQEMSLRIPKSAKQLLKEPIRMKIDIWNRRPTDGDNMQKELLDGLRQAGVILDDNAKIVRSVCWTVREQGGKVKPRVRIEIERWEG